MPVPNFTPKTHKITFIEDAYFDQLIGKAATITEVMQIGRDEAGQLDKKLDPVILSKTGKIIDYLHNPQNEVEAEQELASLTEPDVVIAILRQSFRVRTKRVNDILIRKITDICRIDKTGIAKDAIREATGSELRRLSQLADEIFLNLGDAAELSQISTDPDRTLSVRIRACTVLLERYRDADAVYIALGLFAEEAENPILYESKRRLGKGFGMLKEVNPKVMESRVVQPLLEALQNFKSDLNIRRYILLAIGEVHEPILANIREIPSDQIRSDDRLWLALSLRTCALRNPAATQLMIDWMKEDDIDDRVRLELARRIKDPRIKYYKEAHDDLIDLLDHLPLRYADQMSRPIRDAIINTEGNKKNKKPDELFREMIEQLHEEGGIEDDLLWKLRNPSGLDFFLVRLPHMDGEELKIMYEIITHERYNGDWFKRIHLLIDIFPNPKFRELVPPDNLLRSIYELARNESKSSKSGQLANKFLLELIDSASESSELARQYWKKLGENG